MDHRAVDQVRVLACLSSLSRSILSLSYQPNTQSTVTATLVPPVDRLVDTIVDPIDSYYGYLTCQTSAMGAA